MMNNKARATNLKCQIEIRREILREWLTSGIPEGHELPKSLNGIRTWNDQGLGITAIGSPSSFTTSHPKHGSSIRDISSLLNDLIASIRKLPPTSAKKLLRNARVKAKQYQASLVNSANQYASLTAEIAETNRILRITRQSNIALDQELTAAMATIEKLRRQLSSAVGRASSQKVTSLNFGAQAGD